MELSGRPYFLEEAMEFDTASVDSYIEPLFRATVGAEVQADCMCIVYLCVPVCVIEDGGAN